MKSENENSTNKTIKKKGKHQNMPKEERKCLQEKTKKYLEKLGKSWIHHLKLSN
jgi:hypothetical protein